MNPGLNHQHDEPTVITEATETRGATRRGANYKDQSGSVAIVINKADATCTATGPVVAGWTSLMKGRGETGFIPSRRSSRAEPIPFA